MPVYHYVTDGDKRFYTMRPIEGITLGDLLEQLHADKSGIRAEWPTARLVRLFLQAANAVAYAHSRYVIHRDLKPWNIMIGPFEEVLVLDWGMAKVLGDSPAESMPEGLERLVDLTGSTGSSAIVGTPAYMAPELIQRGPGLSTDVFALGVMLYELLALRQPWTGATYNDLFEAMRVPPPSPVIVQPGRDIPRELGRVALQALAYDPGERFSSVAAFSKAVARALEGRAAWRVEPASRDSANWRLAAD